MKVKEKLRIYRALSLLPEGLSEEILRLAEGRKDGPSGIREIRVRREGVSSLLLSGESIRLYYRVGREETEALMEKLVDGALYAHRDGIASGYICLDGGIRVGICGSARYDGERLVGVGDMRSLLFRIPTGECAFADEIARIFRSGVRSGMLIYSPPGVGKTTALRTLALSLGGGAQPIRVAVVDERCEFSEEDYAGREVDILKGYKRRSGIEIATRTMSPELIMIDEIGADDAEALIGVVRCGIPLVATAHAASLDELMSKRSLAPLFSCGVFDTLVGISLSEGKYRLTVDRI